ncbi:MAG TPA: response regulator, partial [Propionibacteriaceae bacterium]|nr:response regulator [Propionibacteriaceae bacterium]
MCARSGCTPAAGSVRILGLDPARDPDAVRQRVEVQLQEAVLPNRMKVKEGIAVVARERPDVVLMDLRMPQLDGVAAINRITVDQPEVRVLVLTTYDEDHDIVRAIEAGARGVLLKDAPARTS